MLKVERLEVRIEVGDAAVHAVNGVTFSVEAGETVGLVGESGCGKTVTALSIMGLLPPGGRIVTGHVELSGQAVTGAGEGSLRQLRGRAVGMVFQDPMSSLNPTMTIGDQIARPLRHHLGITRHQARARAAEALALVGLPKPAERVDDYPHQLSGGQRQRVMIAMAVACGPKLLIADEPTTALDVTIQAQILELLDDLKASLGMGLLLITHDLGVIARTADRVMVMYAGRIVESASTASVFHRMSHPYTEALLQSLPQVAQRGATLASIPGLPPDLRHPVGGCSFAPRCRYATPGCADLVPPLVEKVPGHRYACYHPVGPSGDRRSATTGVLVGRGPRAPTAPAPAAEPLVEVDRVVKELPLRWAGGAPGTRSVKAVSGVSLSVGRGETFALVGESGCGKTTLGRMLVALEAPDSGRVVFSGQDLADLAPRQLRQRRQQFQLMFQDPASSLDPRVKVGAALREPLAIHQVGSEAERRARVSELLAEVGLDDQAEGLYPHQFSGGQRQRIALARALALRPSLVVADEPVSALDVSIRSQILNLMRRLQADHALTYVLISHDLGVVRNLADRTGVMYLGKLVETGPTEDVYRQPAHPYTAALLAAVPVADPTLERARPRLAIRGELPSAVDPPTGCRYRTRCPLAQEVCAAVEPPMRPFDTAAHLAACHFPLRPPPGAGGSQRAEPTRREEQSLDPT
ncbi:MAG: dipeptide ABC transporter ATP-binding protein [Acidimicrobiales bacterium]